MKTPVRQSESRKSSRKHIFQEFSGFTLLDTLIAVTLTSILVIVVSQFTREVIRYASFIEKHQRIRTEAFALVNNTLPTLIREAAAIDYANTNANQLSLFMDKLEERSLKVALEKNAEEDISQLVLYKSTQKIPMNSQITHIEQFSVATTPKPDASNRVKLQEQRAFQPRVRLKLTVRYQRPEGARARTVFSFFEDPRVSYESLTTLRNYSFSNLRSL